MRIYDLNAYAVGTGSFRLTFNSDADIVTVFVCEGGTGAFDPDTFNVESFVRMGASPEVHGSLEQVRDGVTHYQAWLIPYRQDATGQHAQDGTNGQPDRRRVVDLGV